MGIVIYKIYEKGMGKIKYVYTLDIIVFMDIG